MIMLLKLRKDNPMPEITEIRKILFVDDTQLARAIFQSKLQNYKTQVDTVGDSEDAWRYLTAINNVDVIVCDLNLPGTDGIGLFLKLKAAYNNGFFQKPYHRAFVIVSEDTLGLDRVRQNGIPFITKPKSDNDWLELFKLIEETISVNKTDLVIGDLMEKTNNLDTKIKDINLKVDGIVLTLDENKKDIQKIQIGIEALTAKIGTLPCVKTPDGGCEDLGQNINLIYKGPFGQYLTKNWRKVLIYCSFIVIFGYVLITNNTELANKLIEKIIG